MVGAANGVTSTPQLGSYQQNPVPTEMWLVAGLVVFGALARALLAWQYFGFGTGDDVEQLRAAFDQAFGDSYQPWEIRNLLVPHVVIAPVLSTVSALGIEDPRLLTWWASVPFILCSSLNVALVYALGVRWLRGHTPALVAAAIYSLHWLALGYGSTVYPRTLAVSCVLVATLLASMPSKGAFGDVLAGALVAVAFAARYSEGLYLLPLVGLVLVDEDRSSGAFRRACWLGSGFLLGSLVFVGLVDWWTWGRPFSSLIELTKYTLVEREASSLVKQRPWYWYFWRLPRWMPVTLVPLFFGGFRSGGARRALLFVGLPVILLSCIHHKQLRYLQGVIPFLALASAGVAAACWRRGRRRSTAVLVLLSLPLGLTGITILQKKSMAAVEAAREIGAQPDVRCVALSQPWAYGETLFLPEGIELRELEVRPQLTELVGAAKGCDRIGLYRDVVDGAPELEAALEQAGFVETSRHSFSRSRPVTVYGPSGAR